MNAEQLAVLLSKIETLDLSVSEVAPAPNIADAILAFVDGVGSPATAKNYRQVLTMLAQAWPAVTLDQMTVNDLAQWRVQGLNAVTVRHYLSVLSGFVRFSLDSNWLLWSVRDERRFYSLVRRTRRLVRPARRIQKRPARETVQRMIDQAYERPQGMREMIWMRNIALVETLRCTGMRAAEVAGLTRGALGDCQARVIGKGNKERLVYWDYDAWYALQVYLAATFMMSPAAPVFLRHGFADKHPEPITASSVWRVISELGKQAGVEFHPHLFRHYAISLVAEVNVLAAREFAGHDDLSTTSLYAAGLDDSTREAFRKAFLG